MALLSKKESESLTRFVKQNAFDSEDTILLRNGEVIVLNSVGIEISREYLGDYV